MIRDVAAPAARAKLGEFTARQRSRALDRSKAKTKSSDTGAVQVEIVDEESVAPAADLEVAEPSIPITRSALLLAQLQLKLAEDYTAKQQWVVSHAEVVDERSLAGTGEISHTDARRQGEPAE